MRAHTGENGFTLIEICVVCLVIGILVSIAIPNYARSKAHVNMASCASNQRNLYQAATLYAAEHVVADGAMSCQVLFDNQAAPAGLTDCPDERDGSHDDYVITFLGRQVNEVDCTVDPAGHMWDP